MTGLPQIMVAPNGARKTKADHPALPITKDEIIDCARASFAAGAGAIHAHIRTQTGEHLLDGPIYADLVQALRVAVPDMVIQITTEAAGQYDADHQMKVALNARADLVSVSIREICRAPQEDVARFLKDCHNAGITLQFILYDLDDAHLLQSTLPRDDLTSPALQLLFVLGKYAGTPAKPDDLDSFLTWLADNSLTPDWAVCAFGPQEPACLVYAAERGGKCRTGFENSLHLSDGTIAPDNAAKVADLQNLLHGTAAD